MLLNRLIQIVTSVFALGFIVVGLTWWGAPSFASKQLGMDLLAGAGLSTQIADLASFFLTLGICILTGLWTGRRFWLYPPILLLSFAICGRITAWMFHNADLTTEMIAVEVIMIALLMISFRTIRRV